MQGREDLDKLYEVLDKDGIDVNVEDKYIESVKRRLLRENVPSYHAKMSLHSFTRTLPKPRVRIFERKEEKKEDAHQIRAETEVDKEEEFFEVEKLSEEELKRVLEKERKAKSIKERSLPKEKFVEIVSKVRGLSEKDAEALYEKGYNSLGKILESEPKEISKKVEGLSERTVKKLKKEVAELLPKIEEEFDQFYLLGESKKEKEKIEKEISKGESEFEEELPEWITIEKAPFDEEPIEWKKMESGKPYKYEGYTLYRVEKKGKVRYVFSKKPVSGGEPSPIPKGYIVRIDKRGRPSLEKVK